MLQSSALRCVWSHLPKRKGLASGIVLSGYGAGAAVFGMFFQIMANPTATPADLVQPGHVFPLRSKAGGVLRRAGHTEAAVDLATLAGLRPAGVICEIMNDDGSMARLPELLRFAKKHKLKICTIESLIQFRRNSEKLVERVETVLAVSVDSP